MFAAPRKSKRQLTAACVRGGGKYLTFVQAATTGRCTARHHTPCCCNRASSIHPVVMTTGRCFHSSRSMYSEACTRTCVRRMSWAQATPFPPWPAAFMATGIPRPAVPCSVNFKRRLTEKTHTLCNVLLADVSGDNNIELTDGHS